jgi:hypothetical protein
MEQNGSRAEQAMEAQCQPEKVKKYMEKQTCHEP